MMQPVVEELTNFVIAASASSACPSNDKVCALSSRQPTKYKKDYVSSARGVHCANDVDS